jgi:fluoroacetyl-CoA thioesterase
VLATPVMILIMENAALAAIRPFLDAGESAVGTAIDVRHLAATPVGHEARAVAEVVKVEGKRIEFKVSASDEAEEIGSGTHQRMVIDLPSFNERLARKSKR